MYSTSIVPKVLIVDDMKDNRLIVKLSLKKHREYIFYEAEDGKQGVDIALKELPHIILMDAIMPVMDGFEAIRLLRNNDRTKNIPILMVSALSSKDDKVKALQSGISDFIAKPFTRTELSIRVNSLLNLYIQFLENQKELQDINSHLEEKVNEKLDRRLEEIKLASIGEMAAGITHELNTPVTYMKANLEMLSYDVEDLEGNEELKNCIIKTIDTLHNGLGRLRNIIDSTREISKKGKNIMEQVNIYSTIVFTTRMIYNRAKHLAPIYINNTLFTLDINENYEIFTSNIVKEKIEQVWIIILNNACDEFERSSKKFEQRRIDINISQNDDKTIVVFKDNAGEGISDDMLQTIFEPFVSTKTEQGMGIGLNIAKDIVTQHDGSIRAYSQNDSAIFEVIL